MRMGLAGLLGVVLVALYVWRESWPVCSCDYNGWTHAPEDEREELDRFFSDVVRPGSRSPVATAERAAMTLLEFAMGRSSSIWAVPSSWDRRLRCDSFTTSAGANGSGTSPG